MAELIRGHILGRGSSATVSLAASSTTGNFFAVKSFKLSCSDLLQNEQSIHSSLNCPQIISYLGFEITSLQYNLFIEYASGGSLSGHRGSLSEATIRSHTHDILSGLAYLHCRSIVHCDIKPQNILIGSDGGAKIADFGCARRMNCPDAISNYQVRGTPMFMAPEVARGEEQGPAADVWALGCTVLDMATGRPPWPESDPFTTLHRIAFSSEVPDIPSWISDEGKDFLRKCLVRDLNERWTVDQLLKHPFVSFSLFKLNGNSSCSSPKSTLDRKIWETESEDEELEVPLDDNCRLRIRELEGSCHGGPHWTWNASWTTVRSNKDESSLSWTTVWSNMEESSMITNVDDDVIVDTTSQNNGINHGSMENLLFEPHSYSSFDFGYDGILESYKWDELLHVSCCKIHSVNFTNKSFVARIVDFVSMLLPFGLC